MVATWIRVIVMGVGRTGQIPKDLGDSGMDLEMEWLWRVGKTKASWETPFRVLTDRMAVPPCDREECVAQCNTGSLENNTVFPRK